MEGFDIAGNYLEAGLPNIKGHLGYSAGFLLWGNYGNDKTGPFKSSVSANNLWSGGNTLASRGNIDFNANYANPIYKDDCNTVQPSAYTVRYYIRAK